MTLPTWQLPNQPSMGSTLYAQTAQKSHSNPTGIKQNHHFTKPHPGKPCQSIRKTIPAEEQRKKRPTRQSRFGQALRNNHPPLEKRREPNLCISSRPFEPCLFQQHILLLEPGSALGALLLLLAQLLLWLGMWMWEKCVSRFGGTCGEFPNLPQIGVLQYRGDLFSMLLKLLTQKRRPTGKRLEARAFPSGTRRSCQPPKLPSTKWVTQQ